MPFGTASNRLRKMILFSLLAKHNENVCFRCGKVIATVDDLSIEHKKAWLSVDSKLFWDIDNVAFSHLKCNTPINVKLGEQHGNSKLTEADVYHIRNCDTSIIDLAKTYNVDRSTVYNVRNRKYWKHI